MALGLKTLLKPILWFCPSVRIHKGITIALSLFRSHWLAVVYCLVLCSGSCEPVHEERTNVKLNWFSLARLPAKTAQVFSRIFFSKKRGFIFLLSAFRTC